MDNPLKNFVNIPGMSIFDKETTKEIIEFVKRTIRPVIKILEVTIHGEPKEFVVRRQGYGPIHTINGTFQFYAFEVDDEWCKYYALVKTQDLDKNGMPIFHDDQSLLLRIDSGCETGQRFHDDSCECSDQLDEAMAMLEKKGEGMVICIPSQDGRGRGIAAKLATLGLQEIYKIDTVTAAEIVAQIEQPTIIEMDEDPTSRIDVRTYGGAIGILKFFDVSVKTKINLATNNPEKIRAFSDNGYLTENVPISIEPNQQTRLHLLAKQTRLGHNLNIKHGKN